MRRIWKRRARIGLLVAAVACLGLVGAGEAGAAKPVTVDCITNPSALASAIAGAKKGATLEITGTCFGTFEIGTSLTLAASGDAAALNGGGAGTVLTIDSGITVNASRLVITDGGSTATTAVGGIHNLGTLKCSLCEVEGNSAGVDGGAFFAIGGIYNDGGTLSLTQSDVRSNIASVSSGLAFGGILNEGTMTITGTDVSGNRATATGSSARAGIENGGTLTITGSFVDSNTASASNNASGGILNVPTGTLTVANTFVNNNSASADGGTAGGIGNNGGQVTLSNSAVSNNSANSTSGPAVGGISNQNSGTMGISKGATGQVSQNLASSTGGTVVGGISNLSATVTLTGKSGTPWVVNNTPPNCNFTNPACA
jgi:fibronectin-binding autotransporter adhesin